MKQTPKKGRFIRGGSLTALALSITAFSSCSKSPAPTSPGELRVIADEHGFSPSSLPLAKGPAGMRTNVTFLRTTDKTCATEVVFPELQIRKELPLDKPVVVGVPVDFARTLTFQCGMGMYKGALVVN